MSAPIDVYAFATPNSVKVPIALEELGAAYTLHSVNVRKGEQKAPAFVALNPNAKVPVIVDPEGPEGRPITIVESGAILVYLAEKFGGLLPSSGTARVRCLEWLFFQVSGLGPMFGQAGYFLKSAPSRVDFAVERYSSEARRNVQMVEGRLKDQPWVAGETYTIADVALFGWIWRRAFAGVDLDDAPNVARWFAAMEARPAVQRAVRALEALVPPA